VKAQLGKDAADLAILGRNQRGMWNCSRRIGRVRRGGALGEFVRIAPCLPSLDMCLQVFFKLFLKEAAEGMTDPGMLAMDGAEEHKSRAGCRIKLHSKSDSYRL
jgi:hypothetical protein